MRKGFLLWVLEWLSGDKMNNEQDLCGGGWSGAGTHLFLQIFSCRQTRRGLEDFYISAIIERFCPDAWPILRTQLLVKPGSVTAPSVWLTMDVPVLRACEQVCPMLQGICLICHEVWQPYAPSIYSHNYHAALSNHLPKGCPLGLT